MCAEDQCGVQDAKQLLIEDGTALLECLMTEQPKSPTPRRIKSNKYIKFLLIVVALLISVRKKDMFETFDSTIDPQKHILDFADKSSKNCAVGRGTAVVNIFDENGVMHKCKLKNALYVPSFSTNFISLRYGPKNQSSWG